MAIAGRRYEWGARTYVTGVVNVTPDSFSEDGTGEDVDAAEAQALRFESEGADFIDIGGESTRPPSVYPGARPVPPDEEIRRVLTVIERLARRLRVPISIDTRKAEVARAAVAAGAAFVNDVSMLGDPAMPGTVAELGVPVVVSHTRARAEYADVVREVVDDLRAAVRKAMDAGVGPERIIVDPGIGFGKTVEHSLEMVRSLSAVTELGFPVLIGTSRKSSIGAVLNLPPKERLGGTAATVALSIERGADIVRVHDVKEMVRVARMSDAI
ncbi:MAG: dihydropteroate synthase, partial [Chloroflexi bacterium]|nr:dihydropteroate synthase [Chloroflexota bacterium]